MKIEELITAWEIDSEINSLKLLSESLGTGKLHSKYSTWLVRENLLLAKKKTDYNKLLLDKYQFYTEGAKDIHDVKRAPKGAVLKSEVEKYILADDEIIALSLEISLQDEKVSFLRSIIASINKRSFDIKNAIDHQKFMAGLSS